MPPSLTIATRLALVCLAAVLADCTAMSRVADEPPPGVTLAGNWQLDTHLSTDPRQALKQLVPPRKGKPPPGGNGADTGAPVDTGEQGPPSTGGTGGPGGGGGGRGGRGGAGGPQFTSSPDTNNFVPDITLQQSLLAGGEFLKIEQRDGEFVIANGENTRSFVPGEKSVISVPSGVADQRSGWKGKEYWIEIKPQVGPKVTEKLRLSDKGDQLIETIDVGSEGRVKPLHVTRVYVPARDIPITLPGEN
jgi:hypothetical protein